MDSMKAESRKDITSVGTIVGDAAGAGRYMRQYAEQFVDTAVHR